MEYVIRRYVAGLSRVKSALSKTPQVTDCTKSRTLALMNMTILWLWKKQRFATVVFHLQNKKMILNDKSSQCDPVSLATRLLRTLVLELIGTGRVLKPFWDEQCLANSKRLWLPTEIDCVGSHSNWSSGSWRSIKSKSWFSINRFRPNKKNSLTISSLSSMSSVVKKWESEGIVNKNQESKLEAFKAEREKAKIRSKTREALKRRMKNRLETEESISSEEKELLVKKKPVPIKKPTVNGALKVRILPSSKVKTMMKKWFGTSRYVFNHTVANVNNGTYKPNFIQIKNAILPKDKVEHDWMLETPKDIRAGAIKDAVAAFSSAFSNLKNGNIGRFSVGFRSKKKTTREVINIPSSAVSILNDTVSIYKTYINESIKIHREQNIEINYDIKLLFEKYIDRWYLLIPRYVFHSPKNQRKFKTVAMDPGVRTFLTAYDPNNKVYKFGNYDMRKITPLMVKIDSLCSFRDKNKLGSKKKKSINRRLTLLRCKIRNRIKEFHCKVALFLCRRYNVIVIPKFETKKMSQSHFLHKKTNRQMLSWSHYAFRRLLKDKANQFPNCRVVEVTEEYTSKTCGNCGHCHKIGSSETFSCPKCNMVADRDVNGARNILLKTLNEL